MSEQRHWLYRPENIRKLWIWGIGVLVVSVLAQIVFEVHGHFGFDSLFGFNAIYGFLTCAAMVVFAKLLGLLVKRKDSYYQSGPDEGGDAP